MAPQAMGMEMKYVLVGLLLIVTLAACGGNDSGSDEPKVTSTTASTTTAATTPVATETVEAMATQEEIAEPTTAQTSETTVVSEQLAAEQIVTALSGAGLPIGDTLSYTAETDPNDLLGRPGGYISKTAFHDTRIENPDGEFDVDYGGDVEVFGDADGAETRAEYIEAIVKALPIVTQYIYQSGPIVLRVSAELTPDQAAAYDAALREIE